MIAELLQSFIKIPYCLEGLTQVISISLLFFSHIPPALLALTFGIIIYKNDKSQAAKWLLTTMILFFVWSILDLTTWFSFIGTNHTMFIWSYLDILSSGFFITSLFFYSTFISGKRISVPLLSIGLLLLIAHGVYIIGDFQIVNFNLMYCEATEYSSYSQLVSHAKNILLLVLLAITLIDYKKHTSKQSRSKIALTSTAVAAFMLTFSLTGILTNLQIAYNLFPGINNYNFYIYGLYAMPLMLAFLTYLVVKHGAFNMKMFSAQALVIILLILIGSRLFFYESVASFVITLINICFVVIIGSVLIKNVRKEIESRERIEDLARSLQKSNEDLETANALKSKFLSIASHQFRSPVTALKGYAELIIDGSYGELSPNMREPLERMLTSSNNLALIVNDFLNLSRIESGRMEYHMEKSNLKEITQGAINEQMPIVHQRGDVELRFNVDSSENNFVTSFDPGMIKQVITNLVDNAIKYTQKGVIDVRLDRDEVKKVLRFSVKDSGVGIPAESIDKLFGQFSRASNANTVNVMGTGLGLYIAKEIVKAHKGEIWVESEGEGKGSVFIMELPIV